MRFFVVFDVEDTEILTVAIPVEVSVGIVKGDGFTVFINEVCVFRGCECLSEGRAVFKGETCFAESVPDFAPDLAPTAFVSFVYEDEVVPFKCFNWDAFAFTCLFIYKLCDFDDLQCDMIS